MTDQEVTILDLLAERDRTTTAKLDAIVSRLDASSREHADVRADLRSLHEQLAGVATGAEIASVKRQTSAELDALAGRVELVEDQLGERLAIERWRARALTATGTAIALGVGIAGLVLSRL